MSASRTAVSQSFKNSGGPLLDPPTFRIILQLWEKTRSYLEEGEAASNPSNHVEWWQYLNNKWDIHHINWLAQFCLSLIL